MPLSEPADWPTPFVAAPTTPANQGPIFSQGSRPCAASILELKLGKKNSVKTFPFLKRCVHFLIEANSFSIRWNNIFPKLKIYAHAESQEFAKTATQWQGKLGKSARPSVAEKKNKFRYKFRDE